MAKGGVGLTLSECRINHKWLQLQRKGTISSLRDFQWFLHCTRAECHSYPWGTLSNETGRAPASSQLMSKRTNKIQLQSVITTYNGKKTSL